VGNKKNRQKETILFFFSSLFLYLKDGYVKEERGRGRKGVGEKGGGERERERETGIERATTQLWSLHSHTRPKTNGGHGRYKRLDFCGKQKENKHPKVYFHEIAGTS
jgi:hypothetical protein